MGGRTKGNYSMFGVSFLSLGIGHCEKLTQTENVGRARFHGLLQEEIFPNFTVHSMCLYGSVHAKVKIGPFTLNERRTLLGSGRERFTRPLRSGIF